MEIAADENQLRQALLNLLRNAREAMTGGGRLRVRLAVRPDGMAEIAVSDTGPGIAPEDMSKIFEPFFSTKAKGTGLGLALVQQIVVEHGGRVEVESVPAEGTTFRLVLPMWRGVGLTGEPVTVAKSTETSGLRGGEMPLGAAPDRGLGVSIGQGPAEVEPPRVAAARRGSPSLR